MKAGRIWDQVYELDQEQAELDEERADVAKGLLYTVCDDFDLEAVRNGGLPGGSMLVEFTVGRERKTIPVHTALRMAEWIIENFSEETP